LIDEKDQIVAGHGRLEAALKLKLEQVPVVVLSHLTEKEKRAYIIADNRIAENAEWDFEILKAEMIDIQDEIDLDLLGFGDELMDILADEDQTEFGEDGDHQVYLDDKVVSFPGDLWILGDHRIICGDSTDKETIAKLLAGEKPNLMVTDPPYGVKYDPAWREESAGKGARSKGKVLNDDRADWTQAWELFPGNIAYVWHGGLHSPTVAQNLEACGFKMRTQIIWAKQHFALSRGDYHWQHEPCWYAVRNKGNWCGDRKQATIWNIKNNNAFGNSEAEETFGHGTQKPVECMRRPILHTTQKGDAVYEPFSGSGTTIIACEQTERRCYAVELNPAYVDMAVRRWEKITNRKAILEGSGKAFSDAEKERVGG
jgi:DNA modification methylase